MIVIGSVLTFGFPGFELGGTDSPPSDGPADDPPGADESNDGRDDGDSDEADRDENPDDAERAGMAAIAASSGGGSPTAGDGENADECWIE